MTSSLYGRLSYHRKRELRLKRAGSDAGQPTLDPLPEVPATAIESAATATARMVTVREQTGSSAIAFLDPGASVPREIERNVPDCPVFDVWLA